MQVAVVKPITTHHHRVFKDTPDPPVLYFNTLLTAFSEIGKQLMLKYNVTIRFGYYRGCSEIDLCFGTARFYQWRLKFELLRVET